MNPEIYGKSLDALKDILEELQPSEFGEMNNEGVFYGVAHNISNQLNVPIPSRIRSNWMHGWHPVVRPHLDFYFWSDRKRANPLLTWTNAEAEWIVRQVGAGSDVHPVGAPFLYSARNILERRPNSLLVMPPHTLPGVEGGRPTENYRKQLQQAVLDFDFVAACVHVTDWENGVWPSFLKELGIPSFSVSKWGDLNWHNRTYSVFCAFSHMTTNKWGSHVPYAAYCGCNVSIWGDLEDLKKEEWSNQPFFIKNPHLVSIAEGLHEETNRVIEFLNVDPRDATQHLGWAKDELGENNVRSAKEIALLARYQWDEADLSEEDHDRVVQALGDDVIVRSKSREKSGRQNRGALSAIRKAFKR